MNFGPLKGDRFSNENANFKCSSTFASNSSLSLIFITFSGHWFAFKCISPQKQNKFLKKVSKYGMSQRLLVCSETCSISFSRFKWIHSNLDNGYCVGVRTGKTLHLLQKLSIEWRYAHMCADIPLLPSSGNSGNKTTPDVTWLMYGWQKELIKSVCMEMCSTHRLLMVVASSSHFRSRYVFGYGFGFECSLHFFVCNNRRSHLETQRNLYVM